MAASTAYAVQATTHNQTYLERPPWFFAIIATLCLVIWTLLDLRAPKPARR